MLKQVLTLKKAIASAIVVLLAPLALPGGQALATDAAVSGANQQIAASARFADALRVAASLRTALTEYYSELQSWPDNNAAAGLIPPDGFKTATLQAATVEQGGQFLLTLASEAGQPASLRFIASTDALGVVSWQCTSPDIANIGALLPSCSYRQQATVGGKTRFADALSAAEWARAAVAEYYAATGVWPSDNRQAGLSSPLAYRTGTLHSLIVEPGGKVLATLANDTGVSESVRYYSHANRAGQVSWQCTSDDIANISDLLPNCVFVLPGDTIDAIFAQPRDVADTTRYGDALAVLEGVKNTLGEFYADQGRWPSGNAEAGLPAAGDYQDRTLKAVSVVAGGLVQGELANSANKAETLILQWVDNGNGSFSAQCSSPNIKDIANYLPACRYSGQ